MSSQFEIFNPLKIIDFAVFICTYTYGTAAGIIIAISHFLILPFSGRMSFFRLIINSLLFIQAIVIPYLRFFPVVKAGIIILILKMVLDYILNIVIFRDLGSLKKNFRRIVDFGFWLFIYVSFGEIIYNIMKI
ncbi:hypothetical protein JXB41_07745 [Candidatus Woesearchaeota archaeon]|nr:hypothetical protein [Candidatus Woesearchaeota archaeon]